MTARQAGIGFNRFRRTLFAFVERFSPDETTLMVLVAVLVGLMGGVGAVAFRFLVNFLQSLVLGSGEDTVALLAAIPWWQKILLPVVGGLVVGPLIHFFAREAKGHGVPEVMDAMIFKKGVIRPVVALVKIVASAITIAFGGSVGREGPIVQIGAGLGSTLGQLLRYSPQRLRTLIGCGAAAGIAATFNAPIAGAFFALEVLNRDFAVVTFSPIIVASVVATAISREFLGDTPAFEVPNFTIAGYHELPLYLLLGLIVGVVAMIYVRTLYGTEKFFDGLKMPEWLKPALGGLVLGCLFIAFPQVYGVGYSSMVEALNGEMALGLMGLLVVVKLLAVNITLGSGYSGGIFAPGLFLGGMLGGAFGALVESLVPGSHGAIGTFAMVGMCAMVGSVTAAPLTAILILFEMTGQYTVILPLMLATIGASLVYRAIMSDSIFTLKFTQRGQQLGFGRESSILRDFHVEDIMEVNPVTIPQDKGFDYVIAHFLSHNEEHYYVTSDEGELIGRISIHDVKDMLHESNLNSLVIAADICTPVTDIVYRQDNLEHCLLSLGHHDSKDLPVLYNKTKTELVGLISRRA
ncbi:MAG: CIC family chloride channel protein, partial [Candidatus Krumholzibacteriia bacterium]